ncbi:hypothetical protein L2E82_15760 [Cichorium intybus]|uniref:Uncharacterized protein n=1 Tax=Cichorium intybus TaxID=13427 RepID=A0ACB9F492_CICIN|nr:hypothetical protein L2E82_15760 [Cichorium intybus]
MDRNGDRPHDIEPATLHSLIKMSSRFASTTRIPYSYSFFEVKRCPGKAPTRVVNKHMLVKNKGEQLFNILPLAYLCRHFNQPNGHSLYRFIGLSKVSKLPTQTILEMHIVVYSLVIPEDVGFPGVFCSTTVLVDLFGKNLAIRYLAADGLFPEWKIWTQFLDESTEGLR